MKTHKGKVNDSIELGLIGESWISHIREFNKYYYADLKNAGMLRTKAKEKEEDYYATVERLQATGKYPPGGAEEVARMFLFPELYP